MKRAVIAATLSFAVLPIALGGAEAGYKKPPVKKPTIEQRQAAQADAIEAGRQNGSITYFEGRKLRRDQRRIAEAKANYLSDGRIDKNERARLDRMQDDAAARIHYERTDTWRRWLGLPRVGR